MYADSRHKRFRDYLDVNEDEAADAKRAAQLAGVQYGVWKRYAINKLTRELLQKHGEQINAGAYEL
jgi:ABC-type sugar transport system substrate-binding protein